MKSQIPLAPFLDAEILKQIDLYLEDIYPVAMNAGTEMAWLNFSNAQLRGMETLIASVTRFSEIISYIKNQAGKDKKGQWSRIAPLLLEQLDLIENKAKEIGNEDPLMILDIKMRLARGWAKQVVTHFLFSASQK